MKKQIFEELSFDEKFQYLVFSFDVAEFREADLSVLGVEIFRSVLKHIRQNQLTQTLLSRNIEKTFCICVLNP